MSITFYHLKINNLKGLAWVPGVLLEAVLKRLSFTIRRIGGDTVEDACLSHTHTNQG
ncbi:MAG TPA: hypothetical protein V6D09_13180 [Leptolyngbyaceae cyanobacterium]